MQENKLHKSLRIIENSKKMINKKINEFEKAAPSCKYDFLLLELDLLQTYIDAD